MTSGEPYADRRASHWVSVGVVGAHSSNGARCEILVYQDLAEAARAQLARGGRPLVARFSY